MNPAYVLIVVLGIALVLAPRAAATDEPELAEGFRSRIVHLIKWRPDHGVSLTTTEFAREHARSYPERSAKEKDTGGPVHCPSPREYADDEGIVLFQTTAVDIFLFADELFRIPASESVTGNDTALGHHPQTVCLYERGNPTGKRIGYVGGTNRDRKLEFYEATGEKPLELKGEAAGGCGTNCTFETLEIIALDSNDSNPILLKSFGRNYMRWHNGVTGWDLRIVRQPTRSGEPLVLEYNPVFRTLDRWIPESGSYGHSRPFSKSNSREDRSPLIREECRRQELDEEMVCKRETIRRAKIDDVSMFLRAYKWRDNAKAIVYLIEHQDDLRQEGFIIEEEFIERLKKHLPESMRD